MIFHVEDRCNGFGLRSVCLRCGCRIIYSRRCCRKDLHGGVAVMATAAGLRGVGVGFSGLNWNTSLLGDWLPLG